MFYHAGLNIDLLRSWFSIEYLVFLYATTKGLLFVLIKYK